MRGKDEWSQTGILDLNAKLLVQLPDQGRFRPLSGLYLSAWKLPEPSQCLALGALGDENPSIYVDEGCRNNQDSGQRGTLGRYRWAGGGRGVGHHVF